MCSRCEGKLRTWLGDVLDQTARLDMKIPADYGWDKGAGRQKVSGSPALVRLDVAALTDKRTMRDDDDDPKEPISIPNTVCSWARLFTEEQEMTSDVSTMAAAVSVLTNGWTILINQAWVDDLYSDMRLITQLLNNAHRIERPRPVGLCINVYEADGLIRDCDNPLYGQEGEDPDFVRRLKCSECGRKYSTEVEVMRVRVNHAMKSRRARNMTGATNERTA
jgi:hypothetical protein